MSILYEYGHYSPIATFPRQVIGYADGIKQAFEQLLAHKLTEARNQVFSDAIGTELSWVMTSPYFAAKPPFREYQLYVHVPQISPGQLQVAKIVPNNDSPDHNVTVQMGNLAFHEESSRWQLLHHLCGFNFGPAIPWRHDVITDPLLGIRTVHVPLWNSLFGPKNKDKPRLIMTREQIVEVITGELIPDSGHTLLALLSTRYALQNKRYLVHPEAQMELIIDKNPSLAPVARGLYVGGLIVPGSGQTFPQIPQEPILRELEAVEFLLFDN